VGVVVSANATAIEDLVVENTPTALSCEVSNDWGHWGGVVALVGARLVGGNPQGAAIVNRSILYARNVHTRGFKTALESTTPGGGVAGPLRESNRRLRKTVTVLRCVRPVHS